MCVVSMIGDHYLDRLQPYRQYVEPPCQWWSPTFTGPSREEFDELKEQVAEMVSLLKRAKLYDEATGQPDCENDAKMAVLRKVAALVGVDLDAAMTQR